MRHASAIGGMLLLLWALHSASMAAAPRPITVAVALIEYQFVPDHLTFPQHVHYRLHLENHGKVTHEFTAPAFFAAATIDNPRLHGRFATIDLPKPQLGPACRLIAPAPAEAEWPTTPDRGREADIALATALPRRMFLFSCDGTILA